MWNEEPGCSHDDIREEDVTVRHPISLFSLDPASGAERGSKPSSRFGRTFVQFYQTQKHSEARGVADVADEHMPKAFADGIAPVMDNWSLRLQIENLRKSPPRFSVNGRSRPIFCCLQSRFAR